jgi:cysteine desulfurase
MALDQRGIYAAAGSACSASSELPSHVLTAIGLSDEAARSSLRFSMGRQTTKTEIEHTVSALITLLA